jgi:hypothetical protein
MSEKPVHYYKSWYFYGLMTLGIFIGTPYVVEIVGKAIKPWLGLAGSATTVITGSALALEKDKKLFTKDGLARSEDEALEYVNKKLNSSTTTITTQKVDIKSDVKAIENIGIDLATGNPVGAIEEVIEHRQELGSTVKLVEDSVEKFTHFERAEKLARSAGQKTSGVLKVTTNVTRAVFGVLGAAVSGLFDGTTTVSQPVLKSASVPTQALSPVVEQVTQPIQQVEQQVVTTTAQVENQVNQAVNTGETILNIASNPLAGVAEVAKLVDGGDPTVKEIANDVENPFGALEKLL